MKRTALLLLCIALPACSIATGYSEVPPDRINLFGPLNSYDSPEAVRAALRTGSWTELTGNPSEDRGRSPGYAIQAVSAGSTLHGVFAGEVRLEFYNGRLGKVWFAPERPVEYFEWLGLVPPAMGREPTELLKGTLLTQTGTNDEGRSYIFWQDFRLVLEHARFMRTHGR
jgi:hypothetical protein